MKSISRQFPSRHDSRAGFTARRFRGVLLAAAALLWAGTAIAQQNPGMPGAPMQQQPMPGTPGAPGSPTTGMPGSPITGMPGMSPEERYSDMVFVQDTLESNNAQVQMSMLAQTKSPSPDVQQFGQQMVQVRTELNNQLKPVAKQLGVDDSKGPSKKDKQQIAELEALSGPEFDTAYIMAMAKEQQKSLRAFKDEESNARTPGLQQAAKADEPALSQHYEILQKLAQTHNVIISEAK
jgi:putative membrane protein